jgi:hypothetical protein
MKMLQNESRIYKQVVSGKHTEVVASSVHKETLPYESRKYRPRGDLGQSFEQLS